MASNDDVVPANIENIEWQNYLILALASSSWLTDDEVVVAVEPLMRLLGRTNRLRTLPTLPTLLLADVVSGSLRRRGRRSFDSPG